MARSLTLGEMRAGLPEGATFARKAGHSSCEYSLGEELVVRYWHTDIVRKNCSTGVVRLDSGGHQTATTKKKMNACLPTGAFVFQKDFTWYLNDSRGLVIPFFDGITVDADGAFVVTPEALETLPPALQVEIDEILGALEWNTLSRI
jgi:hypothetical protein